MAAFPCSRLPRYSSSPVLNSPAPCADHARGWGVDRPRRHPRYARQAVALFAPLGRIGPARPLLLWSRSRSPAAASRLLCHSGTAALLRATLLRARPLLARRRARPAPLFRARTPAAALLGRTGTQPLLRPDALFGRPWTTALLRPTALRLRARGTSTLLGSAAFPALGFCGLSALLGTRRRGRALRGAGLFATDLAALRFWCFAAPFGRRAGLTFRAAALPLFGHPRLFALLGRARLAGLLRLLRGARRTQSRRLLGSARSSGARRLLRPAGRTRSARRFTPRFGRCSGLAFLPNRAGPGTRLTRLLRLAGGSRRILAEPALLAGSERRRAVHSGRAESPLVVSRLPFRGRSGVRSCEPRSHSRRRPSLPVPAGGPRRGAADGRPPPQ